MCHVRRPDYLLDLFDRQCVIALDNLEMIHRAVGDRVSAVFVTGTDFGSQTRPMLSKLTYDKLYKPFHRIVNEWIHDHTSWKTFIHSCGAVESFIGGFIDAGFDILNPVQTSASNMDPTGLKAKYGDKITFWGGGVDTQSTLPFGTPEEVSKQVHDRLRTFSQGGGFVFNTIHNVQPNISVDNVLAMYSTLRDHRTYPIK
jgi:uroporphyrinogen-III decarboxylase